MAGETIVGTITQSTTPETHQVRDVSSVLSRLEPDRFPMDTFLRQVKMMGKAEQVKIEWESYKTANRKMTVTAASVVAANAQTAATIEVDTSAGLAPDDLLIPIEAAGEAYIPSSTLPHLIVTAVPDGTHVSVKAFSTTDNTAYAATPIIPKDTILAFSSNAKVEGFTASLPKMVVPINEYNFCEIFDRVVKMSLTREATKNYTQHDWLVSQHDQLVEYRRSIEHALWLNKRSVTNDATNDDSNKRWKMGGVLEFIQKKITYSPANFTEADLIDWMSVVFNGNNGSASRLLFCDSKLSATIQKAMVAKGRSLETVRVAGVTCSKIVFNEGNLLIKHERAFNELGLQNFGAVIDMTQVKRRILRPMKKIVLELEKQGTDAKAEQYKEQSTIELRNPDCHAIVSGEN